MEVKVRRLGIKYTDDENEYFTMDKLLKSEVYMPNNQVNAIIKQINDKSQSILDKSLMNKSPSKRTKKRSRMYSSKTKKRESLFQPSKSERQIE